jgi:hypothetical protein
VTVLALAVGFGAKAHAQAPALPQHGCSYVDQTTSVQSAALHSALDEHKQVIPTLAAKANLKSWYFVPFTANAWSAAPAVTIEISQTIPAACAPSGSG